MTEPKEVPEKRPVVGVSLGCHWEGVTLPHPDPHEPETVMAGVVKRVCFDPPPIDRELLGRFKSFVRKWLRKNLVPLAADTDLSFESWLSETNYPEWRREELRRTWDRFGPYNGGHLDKKFTQCNGFMKDEHYLQYKYPRGIYSRHDYFKCIVGPTIKRIEKAVFALKYFIKKIPVADRPKYINEHLYRESGFVYSSDYTSYEALQVLELMDACEFELCDFMTAFLPNRRWFMRLVREVVGGGNHIKFKNFEVRKLFARMSGEMSTSLGNGFLNLMLMLFLFHMKKIKDVSAVVEGDDGLATSDYAGPNSDDFKRLGIVVKLQQHDSLDEASFCGLIYNREELQNITDPGKVLASFGWASAQYFRSKSNKLRRLLRCKALSLAHSYPGCPIVQSLAKYGLRVTKGMNIGKLLENDRRMSNWEREKLTAAVKDERNLTFPEPGVKTRLLMEKVFGITVDYQLRVEQYFDSKLDLSPIDVDSRCIPVHLDAVHYDLHYGVVVNYRDSDVERPSIQWMKILPTQLNFVGGKLVRWLD